MCFVLVTWYTMLGDMKKMNEDIDTLVDRVISGLLRGGKKHSFRRIRTTIKLSPVTAIILGGMLVLGALVGFLWSSYNLVITQDIPTGGLESEACMLYYDGLLLTNNSMELHTSGFEYLTSSMNETRAHTFSNINGHRYVISFYPDRPDNSDPASPWYGMDWYLMEHGAFNEITSLEVLPETSKQFDIRFISSPLFANPHMDYPFSLLMVINASDITPITRNDDFYGYDYQTMHILTPGVLGNDELPNGTGNLTAVLVTPPTVGILSLSENGSFTFDPQGNAGAYSFTYRAAIGEVEGNLGTVTLHIEHLPAPPQAVNDTYTLHGPANKLLWVTVNDNLGENGSIVSYTPLVPNEGIVLSLNTAPNGTQYFYLGNICYGNYQFSYTVRDEYMRTSTAWVTITLSD